MLSNFLADFSQHFGPKAFAIAKQIGDISRPGTDSIGEKVNQLMPSLYIMIATLGSFVVLLLILTKLLYKPVKKMVKNRQDFIQKNIDDSINAKQNAINLEQEARDRLVDSKLMALEIINKSKLDAEVLKHQYIDQAKAEAAQIVKEAKAEIKAKKQILEEEAHNEIVNVAIEISEKMIAKRITKEEAEAYLKEYLGAKADES